MQTEHVFKVPLIGADAELQEKMLAELNAAREQKQSDRANHSKLNSFANNERRRNRYQVSTAVVCFPVLESHEVSSGTSMVGVAVDISPEGMKVIVDGPQPYNGLELVIGVEDKFGGYKFCSGTVRSCVEKSPTSSEVGIEFRGYIHEILQSDLIYPILDLTEMKYEMPYPDSVMASICKVGAAASQLLDAVLVCPICRALPTFRLGCGHCYSTNVKASRMIHHFACAHVDFVEQFEQEDELLCQKCRTRGMIIGSDYEYLNGPKVCYDCGEANLEKVMIGHCLRCEHRFNMDTAIEMEVIGYRVNKLDILVFIGTD